MPLCYGESDRYLVGIDVPDELSTGVQHMRRALEGSLQRLSLDLYSDDTHFVYALAAAAANNNNNWQKVVVSSV